MLLYHYCSSDTFLKIIENKVIWHSSLDHTNDSTEGHEITNTLEALIHSPHNAQWLGNSGQRTCRLIADNLRNLQQAFAFCMSKKQDLLSQWRGYARDGTGFSIGFDVNSDNLQTVFQKSKPHEYLGRLEYLDIRYKRAEKQQILEDWLLDLKNILNGQALDKAVKLKHSDSGEEYIAFKNGPNAEKLRLHFLGLGAFFFAFKHQAFMEENEARTIIFGDLFPQTKDQWGGIGWSSKGNRLVPHIEVTYDPMSIKEVIIGPKNQTNPLQLDRFLDKHGLKNIKIIKSDAPYR
jgi:hypothetical protein